MNVSIIATLLALAGQSPYATVQQRNALMEKVAKSIALPAGAKPLASYSQNYALTADGKVVAVFIIPEGKLSGRSFCFKGGGQPCSAAEMARLIRENERRWAAYAPAGQRRWFISMRDLPGIADGGCNQITSRYDLATERNLGAFCNHIR